MGKETKEMVVKSALTSLAGRLQVNSKSLELTLKATVCKGMKKKDGNYRPLTNEEFIAFVVVANNYQLNPLIKEIYAYPDTKGDGIIPVVSTDGWNSLMLRNCNYKTHSYVYCKDFITPKGGKPCPEWMEIHIEKKTGGVVVVREYLDECFRDKNFANPWQTHTKRMMRHKTKIQGAREAFGFSGIYDKDEAERIIEGQLAEETGLKGKPEITQPKELPKAKESEQTDSKSAYADMLKQFKLARESIGDKEYYNILAIYSCKHCNEIKTVKQGNEILDEMITAV